jgi:hypothetical protein
MGAKEGLALLSALFLAMTVLGQSTQNPTTTAPSNAHCGEYDQDCVDITVCSEAVSTR